MLDKGLSHRTITLTLVGINLLFIGLTFAFREIGVTWLILSVVGIFFTGIAALYFSRPKPRLFVAKTLKADPAVEINTSKIVPLTKDTILEQKN
jgi:hypothetical protein